MTLKYKNNAQTTLSAGINSSVTSIAVTDGSVFPTLTGIEYFYATFEDVSLNREVVKVTARSGNTLTVVRAQDGTTAQAFSSGDKAEGRLVAAMLADLSAPSYILSALLTVDGVGSGLDADLLDGLSSAAFGQLASVNTWTAQQNISPSAAAAALLVGSAIAYNAGVYIRGNAGQLRLVEFQTGASLRWRLTATATAESGSNAGTNFALAAYDDSGVSLGSAFDVTRATRIVNFPVNPTSGGSAIWNASNDGAGSGLDADLLDGNSSAYYLAASSYTAADVLSKLLTVDGVGSGLDADLLDGLSSAAYAQLAVANVFTATQTINNNSSAAPSPGTTGVVLHLSGADGVSTRLWLDAYGAGTNYTARRANGTNAVKTALIATDVIMNNSAFGYDGTAYSTSSRGAYQIVASQNWAVGAHGTRLILATTPDNSTTQAHRWIVENDGSLMYSGATATGVSTVNALNYFVAGTNISSIYQTIAGYTAADVLAKLLTVDGAGSGLDADLLDGLNSVAFGQLAAANVWTNNNTFSRAGVGDTLLTLTAAFPITGNRSLTVANPAVDNATDPFVINTGNALQFNIDSVARYLLNASGDSLFTPANFLKSTITSAGAITSPLWATNESSTASTTTQLVLQPSTSTSRLALLRASNSGADAITFSILVSNAGSAATAFTINPALTFAFAGASGTIAANTIWHAGNDGAGSGLDADLWDGNQFATYIDQTLTTASTPRFAWIHIGTDTDLRIYESSTNVMTLRAGGVGTETYVTIGASNLFTVNGYNIYHTANDGSGSGLDADLWDGNQFATYLNQAVLTTSAPTFAGATLTAGLAVTSTAPSLVLVENDQGADLKRWDILATAGTLLIRMVNDANSIATNLVTITRTSTYTAATWNYAATTTLQYNSNTIWHAGNDGAGSGLDADLWDGNNFATYLNQALLTTSTPTFGGLNLTSATGFLPQAIITNTNDDANAGYVIFYKTPADTTVTAADYIGTILWYGRGSSSANGTAATIYARAEGTRGTNWVAADLVLGSISTAGTYRYLALNAVGTMTWNSSTVWTAANDGAGSGLDADTLDSYNVGTSGATIPLLNANNTYSGISAFTGQVTMSRGAVPLQLTTTVDNGNVQGMIIEGDRATPTANDVVYMDWRLSNSAGTQTEFGRQSIVASTVTAASEASYWMWAVRAAGTLTNVMQLSSSALTPNASDGIGLGSTALMWSDLFLASGGVVNFNNGDVTITHSADTLAFAGAATGYTFDGPVTISSTAANNPLVITSTEAGATAFTVDLFRNSASPAAADGLAALRFRGRNSTPATVTYSSIQSNIADATAASEDANLYLQTMMAGTLVNALTLGQSTIEHRFTTPTDSIVSSQGTNGYGAFLARGSGTNAAYIFLSNITSSERGRIWATNNADLMFSTNAGVTSHLAINSAGAVTASNNTVWHAGNDGAGSLLDADLLDGLNSTQFVRADSSTILTTGVLVTTILNSSTTLSGQSTTLAGGLEVRGNGTGPALMSFHRPSAWAAHIGIDTDNIWKVGGWSMGANAYPIWHSGVDGSGSGLDADTVDGYHMNQNVLTSSSPSFVDVTITSDERLKSDIIPIASALEKVRKLRGAEYTRRATGKREIGVIAQDLEAAGLELLVDRTESNLRTVKYMRLSAVLIEAVKELAERVEQLERAA